MAKNSTTESTSGSEEKMYRMVIDFSGQQGLVSRYFGDFPYNATNPQLSMNGGPSQYASGVVDPIAKYGYLSPANGTYITVLNDTSGSRAVTTATEVDEINLFAFFFDALGTIRRTLTLTQTAITASAPTLTNARGTDLEFYSSAGIRKLFFAYTDTTGGTGSDIGVWDTHGVTSTNLSGDQIYLYYTNNGNTFATGDTLTGSTSGATGHISGNNYQGGNDGTLFLESITGSFVNGEVITDGHAHTGNALVDATHTFSSLQKNFMSALVGGGIKMSGGNTRMIVADNAFMYILDGSFVHKYDGTITGSVDKSTSAFGVLTTNVLEFPPGFTLTDGIDYRGRLWITLFRSIRDIFASPTNSGIYENYCGVYVWDRETTGTSTQDFIEVPGVREIRAIVNFQSHPYIFDVSASRYTELRVWTGSQFKVVEQLGPEAYPRFHDSVAINGEMMSWLGNDGKMYYYGSMNPGSNNALWMIGDTTTQITALSLFNNGGAILLANDSESESSGLTTTPEAYYLSMLDTSAAKTLKWYPHAQGPAGASQLAAAGNYFSIVKPLPKLSQTHFLTLFYPPVGSGGTNTVLSVNIYFNQSATAWNASPIALNQNDALRGYKTIPINATGVNFIQIGLIYPTSTVGLTSIPTISYASVDYNPTSKII